jgi:hypothetical protein
MAKELRAYPHLAQITKDNKSLWSWCRKCAPHYDAIMAWRATQPSKIQLIADPRAVWQRWQASLPDGDPAKEKKAAPAATTTEPAKKSKDEIIAGLERDNHDMQQRLERAERVNKGESNINFGDDDEEIVDMLVGGLIKPDRILRIGRGLQRKAEELKKKPARGVSRGVLVKA